MSSAVDRQLGAGTVEGFPTITLTSADRTTQADFVPEANMLCCSLRYRGAEVLHKGDGVHAYASRGATMGIPLLHPWANRLSSYEYRVAGKHVVLPHGTGLIADDGAGLPIHGVVPGLMRWDVSARNAQRLRARFRWASPPLLRLFPFAHELTVDVTIATGTLTIATTLLSTGDDSVPVSFGYHPYLRIPGIRRQDWQVDIGASRRLVLDERMIPTRERQPVARRALILEDTSLDDGFDALAAPATFAASASDTRIAAEFLEGYAYAQIYAPARSDFVCFEAMTAPTNALNSGDGLRLLNPGEQHHAAFTIAVTGKFTDGVDD
jgi:aldose 1-epimerase